MGPFSDRVVVVTGGARGIGAAVAKAFVDADAEVVSLDVAPNVEPRPGIRDLVVDVTDEDDVGQAFSDIDTQEGSVDVLVNNAGIQIPGALETMTLDAWSSVVATHLRGMFLCSRAAIPRLRRRDRGGTIVSIASVAAMQGLPGRGPYSAAKAGILGLTRSMSVELADEGIRVNAVAPGFTMTPLVQQALDDGSLTEEWMIQRVPLGRIAQPSEIAKVVLFLAGSESSYITGQCITVDGGWSIQGILGHPDWL